MTHQSFPVLGFYGHHSSQQLCQFSNFWQGRPYSFIFPEFARSPGYPATVTCEFAEKAIMLTKAVLMGDADAFSKILQSRDPGECKELGRGITPFDEVLWKTNLREIAFSVVLQKFQADPELRALLLSTGELVLAEATKNDCIWGIGLDRHDPAVQNPTLWKGQNVLGEALMSVRSYLRRQVSEGAPRSMERAPASLSPHFNN